MQSKFKINKMFPQYTQLFAGGAYFDSGASTLASRQSIEVERQWYYDIGVNADRGMYRQSEVATAAVNVARRQVAHFINAQPQEIVFTKGATEGINTIANSWARNNLKAGDTIILTVLEHHANTLPWKVLAKELDLEIVYWNIDDEGNLINLSEDILIKASLLCITHISNVTGHVVDIKSIITMAHARGIPVLVDAAQSVGRMQIDVADLDVDFLVASGHKMYGPTGVGFIYIAQRHHDKLIPYQLGGSMIELISGSELYFKPMPYLLEAGTLPLAQIQGLSAAVSLLENITMDWLHHQQQTLTDYAVKALSSVEYIQILPFGATNLGIVSCTIDTIHSHDIAYGLAQYSIAVRSGHHCAQPLHYYLKIPGSIRFSFGVYNNTKEIDHVVDCLKQIITELQ